MKKKIHYELKVVRSLGEIPDFSTEDEERDWWAEHELSEELWNSLPDATAELDEIAPLPDEASRSKAKR